MSSRISASLKTRRARVLSLESLENRLALSSVNELEPNNSSDHYQPLNGATSYYVRGSTTFDHANPSSTFSLNGPDYYGVYLEEGAIVHIVATFTTLAQQMGDVRIYHPGETNYRNYLKVPYHFQSSPSGDSLAGTFTVDYSGVWTFEIAQTPEAPRWDLPYTFWLTGAALPSIELDKSTYYISAGPSMPTVTATLKGVAPDPEVPLAVEWKTKTIFNESSVPRGIDRDLNSTFKPDNTTGKLDYTPSFDGLIRGGKLRITASTEIRGQALWAITDDKEPSELRGLNPSPQSVKEAIEQAARERGIGQYTETLIKIAHHETSNFGSYRQFVPYGYTGENYPLFSDDHKGGVGIFQITNPAPTPNQIWDWKANVDAGVQKFKQALGAADHYAANVQSTQRFKDAIDAFNHDRLTRGLPAVQIIVPSFDATQLRRDAIRGFNGFGGSDYFSPPNKDGGRPLHEYRIKRYPGTTRPVITVDEVHKVGRVVWEEVPVSQRPMNSNYVNIVESQQI
jgi:hypothetical protein